MLKNPDDGIIPKYIKGLERNLLLLSMALIVHKAQLVQKTACSSIFGLPIFPRAAKFKRAISNL